jgi:DNA sulfur modification protein DndD
MLWLRRLEVEGFGPFAGLQAIDFPAADGIVVVYGENMRGKTSLLNAIRYAFFGKVLSRGSRVRRLHVICNRERAARGEYGFSVALYFKYGNDEYELLRSCEPTCAVPKDDSEYREEVMLRRGSQVLGPQQREHALHQTFPDEISRFFLFDGELLQEYEELVIAESEAGPRISEAIERILGVPVLKRGRMHLTQLSEDADKQAAKEASRSKETQSIGEAMEQAAEQREAHQQEVVRKQAELVELQVKRSETEAYLQSTQKYAGILEERDQAGGKLEEYAGEERRMRGELQKVMGASWRALLRGPIQAARDTAREELKGQLKILHLSMRAKVASTGYCHICNQNVSADHAKHLLATVPTGTPDIAVAGSRVLERLALMDKFDDADPSGEIKQLWRRIRELQIEQLTLRDRIVDLNAALADSDPETIRHTKNAYSEVIEKIVIVRRAIEEHARRAEELDQGIQKLKKRLEATGTLDMGETQFVAKTLRAAAEVLGGAVERYKAALRERVEKTATELFRAMSTEKEDYQGLSINTGYGLTIIHKDGKAEEARSAGAEHVVALALMGSLQRNAPLRGPIVMDSPFGRLDDRHTSNVIQVLPEMARQVILLVYESEVGRSRVRELLGSRLLKEYELVRVSARHTDVREIR